VAIGGATGAVGSILGVEERPRFREYVIREHHPSFRYRDEVRVGPVLPEQSVKLYAVPRQYHVGRRYRYAIVNDRAVIVEPRSRRIVEVIEQVCTVPRGVGLGKPRLSHGRLTADLHSVGRIGSSRTTVNGAERCRRFAAVGFSIETRNH